MSLTVCISYLPEATIYPRRGPDARTAMPVSGEERYLPVVGPPVSSCLGMRSAAGGSAGKAAWGSV